MEITSDKTARRIVFDVPPRTGDAWVAGILAGFQVVLGFTLVHFMPDIALVGLAIALLGGPFFARGAIAELTAHTATLDGQSQTLTVHSVPHWGDPETRSITFSDITDLTAYSNDNGESVVRFVDIRIAGQPHVHLPFYGSDTGAVAHAVDKARRLVGLSTA